jgi:4-carboxymuconolactone decarboxylase
MARLKALAREEMDAEQQALMDEIANGPRKAPMTNGPGLGWLRNPKAGHIAQQMGAFCRFGTGHPDDVVEIIICTTARYWSQPYEWWAHKRNALKVNVDPAIIDAIENRQKPKFQSVEQEVAHDITKEMLENKKVSNATYERALNTFGEKKLVELTQVVGYYSNIAIQMNCFEVAPDEGPGAIKDPAFK